MSTNQTPLGLDIAIVGAGIAGLSTAIALLLQDGANHRVTVLEKYANCQPTFSGPIQIHTNGTRVLKGYGVSEAIEACLPELRSVHNIHRLSDGHLLYNLPTAVSQKNYKLPVWNMNRSDLLGILLARATGLGALCQFSAGVADIDAEAARPLLTMEDGGSLSFDLVVACDGVRSKIRTKIMGNVDVVHPLTAYSISVDREKLKSHDDLQFFFNTSGFWMGPKQTVVGVDLRSTCNLVFCTERDDGEEGVWDKPHDVEDVKKQFSNAEPRLHKLMSLASGACFIWQFSDLPELDTWTSRNGRVVLLGDAAHAMLPFAAQGAGSSIEDSACLAECITRSSSISKATAAFEAIRKPRTTYISKAGRLNMKFSHMPHGPEQEARDAALAKMREEEAKRAAPAPEATPAPRNLQDFEPPETAASLFTPIARSYVSGYDIIAHTKAYLKTLYTNGLI
ncbi:Salicylate hydroxylase [Beauveria brongniartii RCEF 3172]|uniref:Salicylate hydroxylase n=1 Tax=Beauveria brongniartii RCEF 3172 TaxID=1081107 RepID=A0A167K097_9HYPO|nr:Salicylate hydroxylase [Beauveria brongniartii RCEF 3172]